MDATGARLIDNNHKTRHHHLQVERQMREQLRAGFADSIRRWKVKTQTSALNENHAQKLVAIVRTLTAQHAENVRRLRVSSLAPKKRIGKPAVMVPFSPSDEEAIRSTLSLPELNVYKVSRIQISLKKVERQRDALARDVETLMSRGLGSASSKKVAPFLSS